MLRKNILAYYGANFLLIIAQSLPHAILTPLLLSKGLSLSEILLVQTFFSFCVLVAEYPSGVLADVMSRKNLFLVSNAFLIASFSLVLFFDSFILMLLAWGLYGLYSACSSGTIEASLITDIKENKKDLSKFLAKNNQITYLGMIIGSSLGSFLYLKIHAMLYVVGIFLIMLCVLTIVIYFKEKEEDFKSQKSLKLLKEQVKGSLKELRDNPKLKILLVGHLITPIFFMSHFQMWQAYFLKQGVKEQYLFVFYIAFQVISILIHFLNAKNYSQKIALSSLLVLLGVSPLLLSNIPYCFIGVYALMVAFFTYMSYCLGYQFSKFVSKNNISSLSSSCVRVVSVLVLSLSSLELRYFSPLTIITMHFALTLIILFFFLYKAKPFDE
ncbi:HP1165 family MFS efflux transporter [Helicobacter pylori]|uniref:HP1165 family MFS efflux transporter n=1 Tax=Helicobacter pylori TaxID=210 RepID=UPI002711E20A|nr:HP1165 family MFS efflux transporter [Helicobacter pylori]MDO7815109.1 HP1165 family MFS efflux transporter [Helicobacter pylori]MDO7819627.1 HP1165 family MFS efflux transporter [Helicobacter pylori]MDO7828983.1 HP1165 family MFS efflux transporter [Helicobacter pylori]MDO7866316.1 HP1165 family MFS efflux transporter [Helicobacter pylori]WQU17159.1 MFS transporter [Helicobacter pylori]